MKLSPLVIGALAATACLLVACVRPPREDVEATRIESSALGLTGPEAPRPGESWWKAFNDPQLDRLVDDALAHNPRLDEALARIRASSAQSLATSAALIPGVSLDLDETYQRFSENYYIPPPYGGNRYWAGTAGLNLGWALDFWGRQRDLVRQAGRLADAERLERWSARLAISGSLAQAYLDLYRAYALGDVAQRTLNQREHLLDLAKQRFDAGIDTPVELKIATARLADARDAIEQTVSLRELAIHRLAALSAHGADYYTQIGRPQLALDSALPIPEALPMDLLARRPDVLAARSRIDAADAARAASKAAFYPDLSLRAFVGTQAIGLNSLVQGGSIIYGAGPVLHLPVFDARRLRAAYRSSTAQLDSAIASYNDVVLNAVRQTADQLTVIQTSAREQSLLHERLDAARAAYDFAQQRYGAGISTQLTVLNAESEVLSAERDLISLEANRAIARVTLLLTLGGSFDPGVSQ